jgi:chemotaxis protein MotB
MARKKKHPEHVNHERWLVSYADFITLLFAFFVVMFAVSQVDSKKVGRFTESFSKAVGIDMFPQAGRGLLAGASQGTLGEPEPSQSSPLPADLLALNDSLTMPGVRDEIQNVQIFRRRNELVLRLSDGFLFESGNDALEERARKVVSRLATELRGRPLEIRIEGHTDDRPIRTSRFRSNWDLSTARATAVVARLAAEGIDPPRLSAAGYGEFHPLASNATEEGRRQNRRVDFVVSVIPTPTPVEEPVPARDADAGAPAHAPSSPALPTAAPHPKEHP